MQNNSKLILLDQIKLSYPNNVVSHNVDNRDEILIKDFPFENIKMEISGRLDIYFGGFDKVDFESLSTYFKPRLKHKDCRIFYNSLQLNIYMDKQFNNDKKGNFEKAMWTFRVLEFFKGQIKTTINEILNNSK